jgi:hypothetical protein
VVESQDFDDDPTISDSYELWRRVHPMQVVQEEDSGAVRPTSQAFSDPSDGTPMSVYLAEGGTCGGRTPDEVIARFPGYGLVALSVQVVRQLGLRIRRRPLPDEPMHAEVYGQKTTRVRKALAKVSTWLIRPPPNE